ncbi:PC4 and SFRS1-interacting protein isoform X1 [Pseudomyrmex gracilis]|uniref:PC4 and SFRS1-interacting protein isoform X1 n=1 Tax=Pseudomyrmex gracilis TaxID=219809 RepID=UPI000994BFDD|nr:PC4 and SFRS1-interacting protein isoform X1 [Pseudomyrmex gracilis]
MVKLLKKFFTGDKVFAKVRGYPPWPARVEKVNDPNSKNARYSVFFYGTGETAVCKVEELYSYTENKDKYGKPNRRKFFHEGIQQLEQDLKNERNKTMDDIAAIKDDILSIGAASAADLPTVSATDSDIESGSLVIDEGDKKKFLKRKPFTSTPNTSQDTPEVKKRRGRAKASTDISKQEALDSQGEESPKEVVSRSGRKIKPKRFADFSSSDETEPNIEHGRGRKAKNEDPNEHQITPNVIHKKRAAIEKRNNVDEGPILDGTIVSSTTSSDTSSRVLLARTFAGEHVGIKLDVNRPKSFESEKARAQWDWSTARNAMKLKAQLESGEILPEQVKDSLDFNVPVPEDEKNLSKDGAVHRKTYKLRWLRIEAQLLQLDAQIKSSLGLDRADTDRCLEAMDNILALSIDPLMLKKHPHIVETVKRLRRYVGNLGEWKLSEEEGAVFKQKAEQIRQKAEHIYNKFKAMFTIPEGQSFWQSFSNQVVHFKELTKNMSEEKVFSLMSDPAAPDAGRLESPPTADESGSYPDIDVPAEVEPAAEPEPEPESEAENKPESEPEHEVEAEPKSKSKTETESESISQAQRRTEPEIFAETEVEAEVPASNESLKDEGAK